MCTKLIADNISYGIVSQEAWTAIREASQDIYFFDGWHSSLPWVAGFAAFLGVWSRRVRRAGFALNTNPTGIV